MPTMHPDDLNLSLERADCDDARELLTQIRDAEVALRAVPRGRQYATAYGRAEARRDQVRRDAAKIVEARGWFRRLPSDDHDGSFIGHEDR
jgi:23S rRNA C2498 (ribose-2'-O)-methylase RlmM